MCFCRYCHNTCGSQKFRPTWRKRVSLNPTLLRIYICGKGWQQKAKWSLPVVSEKGRHHGHVWSFIHSQIVILGVEEYELKAMTVLLTNHSFICLFTLSIYLSTYYVPDTVTGAEDTVNEANPPPSGACPLGKETATTQAYSHTECRWRWALGREQGRTKGNRSVVGSRWPRRDAEMTCDMKRQDKHKWKESHKGPGREGRKWITGQSSLRALGPSRYSGLQYYPIFYTISARSSRPTLRVTSHADGQTRDIHEDDISPL